MKIAPCILLCLVLLSIFYCYTVASVSYATSNITTANHSQNVGFGISAKAPRYNPLGDPITSPRPNADERPRID